MGVDINGKGKAIGINVIFQIMICMLYAFQLLNYRFKYLSIYYIIGLSEGYIYIQEHIVLKLFIQDSGNFTLKNMIKK